MKQATASSRPRGRLIGLVYLLYFATAIAGGVLLKQVALSGGDAAATANSILANQGLYQLSISLGVVGNALYLALTALFYDLLKPVGARAALLFAFFSLAGCVVQLCGGLFQVAPLVILKDSQLLTGFQPAQAHAAVMLALKMSAQVYPISFVLFGLFDICIGWLIFRSTFLPRILGALMMLGGLFALVFLWPPVATRLFGVLVSVGGVAELLLMLWLLVFGVNVARWREKTSLRTA